MPACSFVLGERKCRRVLENISVIHAERVLDVDRALAFDAETAVARQTRDNLRAAPPATDSCSREYFFSASRRIVFIVARKQSSTAYRARTASWCENPVPAAPARECCRRSECGNRSRTAFCPATCRLRLLVAAIHLLVTFVAVKRPAERFRRRDLSCLQLRQPTQEHVDLENRSFIRAIRLIDSAGKLCQHIPPEIHQEKPRLDRLRFFLRR